MEHSQDYILDHKINLTKLKTTETTYSMFHKHNETNNKNKETGVD